MAIERNLLPKRARTITWSGAAIQGTRDEQQDSFCTLTIPNSTDLFLVLADGMGGHFGGATASEHVVKSFIKIFSGFELPHRALTDAFKVALDAANDEIHRLQVANPTLSDMGSTVVAIYLTPMTVSWISVGDSPLWLVRGNSLQRLNDDHSLRSNKQLAPRLGNVLLSALNGRPPNLIDQSNKPVELEVGDRIAVASDGLLTLDEREIAALLSRRDFDLSAVVSSALSEVENRKKSKQDNCTLLVAEITDKSRTRNPENTHSSWLR